MKRAAAPPCPLCAPLGEEVEIENAQQLDDDEEYVSLPEAARRLVPPNPQLAFFFRYSRETILKCPACGDYFWYREWAPGGSEDVMRTYIHESVTRLSPFQAHVKLDMILEDAQGWRGSDGGRAAAEQGVAQEKRLLKRCYRRVIAGALEKLEDKHAYSRELESWLKPGPAQLQELREREQRVAIYHAKIISEYLGYWPSSYLTRKLVQRIARRLQDDNPEVVQVLVSALAELLRRPTAPSSLKRWLRHSLEQHGMSNLQGKEILHLCLGEDEPQE